MHLLCPCEGVSGITGKLGNYPSLRQNDITYTLKASYDRKREIKMFLDNLSTSILRLCDSRKLSYEAASERCEISSRYFGDIARGKTAPTILTLEKLCIGFDLTPNELLLVPPVSQGLAFQTPTEVTQVQCLPCISGLTYFSVCPRYKVTLEREYQFFCDRCGQCLNWKNFSTATIVLPKK